MTKLDLEKLRKIFCLDEPITLGVNPPKWELTIENEEKTKEWIKEQEKTCN